MLIEVLKSLIDDWWITLNFGYVLEYKYLEVFVVLVIVKNATDMGGPNFVPDFYHVLSLYTFL